MDAAQKAPVKPFAATQLTTTYVHHIQNQSGWNPSVVRAVVTLQNPALHTADKTRKNAGLYRKTVRVVATIPLRNTAPGRLIAHGIIIPAPAVHTVGMFIHKLVPLTITTVLEVFVHPWIKVRTLGGVPRRVGIGMADPAVILHLKALPEIIIPRICVTGQLIVNGQTIHVRALLTGRSKHTPLVRRMVITEVKKARNRLVSLEAGHAIGVQDTVIARVTKARLVVAHREQATHLTRERLVIHLLPAIMEAGRVRSQHVGLAEEPVTGARVIADAPDTILQGQQAEGAMLRPILIHLQVIAAILPQPVDRQEVVGTALTAKCLAVVLPIQLLRLHLQ